jgi:Amt family ammonium transporter
MARLKFSGRRRGRSTPLAEGTDRSIDQLLNAGRSFYRSVFGRAPLTWLACVPLTAIILGAWSVAAHAAEPLKPEDVQGLLNMAWVMVAAILVIFMNAGFCMLETGFCRQKNAVNVLTKNLIVFALATLAFWALGYGFMFAQGNNVIGTTGFFLTGDVKTYDIEATGLPVSLHFMFQVAFAGTAATIVSGAVAERVKFVDFLIFSLLLVGVAYAITGRWVWSGTGGWLFNMGFRDFAGSTVVHSVGGWAALMGAAILGPRMGKYENGKPRAIPGHNMSIATLGCLILWIGWFGFNPGSTLAVNAAVPYIAVTTNLAGAAGGLTATVTSWWLSGKPDLSMVINGILAGLVAITAGCNVVDYPGAVLIGGIAGILVVLSVGFFDSVLKIDDPVGATSVHLVCGAWGTIAVGLFSIGKDATGADAAGLGLFYGGGFTQLGIQLLGVAIVGGVTVLFSTIFWAVLNAFGGIRVSPEEEAMGLDIGEHGMEAYTGFLKDNTTIGPTSDPGLGAADQMPS